MIADNEQRGTNGNGAHGRSHGQTVATEPDLTQMREQRAVAHDDQPDRGSIDEQPNQSKRPIYKRPLLMALLALVLIVGGFTGTKWYLHARAFESTDDAFVEGHVVQISTKSAGYVQTVAVDDNQHVKKGDLLVQIDPRDYGAKLAQEQASLQSAQSKLTAAKTSLDVLNANVQSARSDLTAAQANYEYAKSEAQRFASMPADAASWQERHTSETSERASAANVESARAKVAAAEAQAANGVSQVKTAEADVAVAQTRVRQAELDLSYTTIVAPDTGRVTRKNIEPGSYVQLGQALLAVVPDDVWVVANYKETQLDQMRPGQTATVSIDAYPGRDFKAHVDSIQAGTGARFSMLPPENATGNYVKVVQRVPVKIVFDEPIPQELAVAPGMSVVPDVRVK